MNRQQQFSDRELETLAQLIRGRVDAEFVRKLFFLLGDLSLGFDGKERGPLPLIANYALTLKERYVHDIVALGKCNKEVSAELKMSVKSVKAHLSSVYKKLGLSGRGELIYRARAEREEVVATPLPPEPVSDALPQGLVQ